MKRWLLALVLLPSALACVRATAGEDPAIERPFESDVGFIPVNAVDLPVLRSLRARGIAPAHLVSDEAFFRRAYLDVIGTLPEPAELRLFLLDPRPEKRAALVDALLEREEYAEYGALRWGDVLRVKSEFPINLWPNAVQAYHRWIRDAIRENRPYDRFARELLTSSGSNFRVPPVNFWRAIQGRDAAARAAAVSLTFLGVRWSSWPEEVRVGLTAAFSRVAYKRTAEWKEEIVLLDPTPADPMVLVFPDGSAARLGPDDDPRRAFADWLVTPDNPWFARAVANRVWTWLMGRGIVHEADDVRPDNPPSNPELLAVLARELVASGWDLKHLHRLILNSRTYQQSPIPRSDDPRAEALFAHYPVRRLDAEVLVDALSWLDGSGEGYESVVPEPWTLVPAYRRTIGLSDGTITSSFLEMFGRPARDSGFMSERSLQPTDAQRLYLLNSSDVQRKIERSRRFRTLLERTRGDPKESIRWIYLTLLSREPTERESAAAEAYARTSGLPGREAANDLIWALVNSKEFLYRH